MNRVLHVGCGPSTIQHMPEGFRDGTWAEIRFDIDPDARPDIIGTMTDMSAVADESVDAVYSAHNIEHVFAHEVGTALGEFRRVLKPDGFVALTCPDLQSIAAQVAQGRLIEPLYTSPAGPISALDVIFGYGQAIQRGETYMAHRTGFTGMTLRDAMVAAGFVTVGLRRREFHFDLWAVGTKSVVASERMGELMGLYCRA